MVTQSKVKIQINHRATSYQVKKLRNFTKRMIMKNLTAKKNLMMKTEVSSFLKGQRKIQVRW